MKEQVNKQHLFWRAGFGATPRQLRQADHQSVRKVVRTLFSDSQTFAPLPVADGDQPAKKELKSLFKEGKLDRDSLKDRIRENRESIRDLNVRWVQEMASGRAHCAKRWRCSGTGILPVAIRTMSGWFSITRTSFGNTRWAISATC